VASDLTKHHFKIAADIFSISQWKGTLYSRFVNNSYSVAKSYKEQPVTFHSLTEPSSLHEANKPATHGFQLSPFTSNVSALAAALNDGRSSSPADLSSANICTQSSPPAEAIRPVSRHLIKQDKCGQNEAHAVSLFHQPYHWHEFSTMEDTVDNFSPRHLSNKNSNWAHNH